MQIVDALTHVWGSGLPSNLVHRQVTAWICRNFHLRLFGVCSPAVTQRAQ